MLKFNYGEYIFQQLMMTDFVQQKLAIILMSIVVNIIQMHIVSILCMIITFHPIIDFIVHTIISIIATLNIDKIYNIVERYEPEFVTLTQYLINNYSFENYRYWKRIIVLSACGYLCIILWKVQVTSWLLFIYIIQYGICFTIVDQFEEQRIQRWVREWTERPIIKTNKDNARNMLLESYMSPKINVLQTQKNEQGDDPIISASPINCNDTPRITFNDGLVKPVNNMKKLRKKRI